MLRLVCAFLLLLIGITPAAAQAPSTEIIRLWPGTPPGPPPRRPGPEVIGSEGGATGAYSGISEPRIEVYRPARPNGAAVLVIGGGGYFRIQIGSAARPMAQWLASEGITAFVLFYRLPGDGWAPEAPFQDGQRAMRIIRSRAAQLGIDPARLGVLGSSAGGHLAGMLATQGDVAFYPAADAVDALPARPAFAGLLYPVVSMRAPIDTTRSARELGRAQDFVARFSIEQHVDRATPPIFMAHAADDPIADPRHSLWLAEALRAAGRPVELHLFASGGHSWGMGRPGTPVVAWPALFRNWLQGQGFMR